MSKALDAAMDAEMAEMRKRLRGQPLTEGSFGHDIAITLQRLAETEHASATPVARELAAFLRDAIRTHAEGETLGAADVTAALVLIAASLVLNTGGTFGQLMNNAIAATLEGVKAEHTAALQATLPKGVQPTRQMTAQEMANITFKPE